MNVIDVRPVAKTQVEARSKQYRPDIDGLRAISVVAVVFFHAQFQTFSGGFVGVDVFFVISGYLITSIILDRGSLSWSFFQWFYERRIRRLFPPVIPVLIFSGVAAYKLLPPDALEEYGRSVVAFLTFWSNWFFWSISGYFDQPAQIKPLLHTWSLSIEEQFYILFPTIILVACRKGRSAAAIALGLVAVLSFCVNAVAALEGYASLAFFNSFGRFWEIAVGSLLAAVPLPRPRSETTKTLLGSTGIFAIAWCVFSYDGTTPFATVVPALGAALIIYANGGLAGRVLSTPPLVGLGLISYAVYLWHWPIFVFIALYRYHPTSLHYGLGIVATIALSTLSFFLIERPIREKRFMVGSRTVFAFFGVVGAVLGATAIATAYTGGFPGRFPKVAEYLVTAKAMRKDFFKANLRRTCWISGKGDMAPTFKSCIQPDPTRVNVLLVGDSHAAQFYDALSHHAPGVNVDLVAVDSCVIPTGGYPGCNQLNSWLRANLANAGYDYLVISSRGISLSNLPDVLKFATQAATHTSVLIFGPIQYYQPNMPTIFPTVVGLKDADEMDAIFDDAIVPSQFEVDRALTQAKLASGVTYVSLLSALCPNGPLSCSHLGKDGLPILIDDSHLSLSASAKLINDISPTLPF